MGGQNFVKFIGVSELLIAAIFRSEQLAEGGVVRKQN
jgi:hypothetical protein